MTSTLERFFDTCLFINLDRRVDRRTQSDAELNLLHFDYHARIAGIDNPENGNAGCTATHRLLWRRIASGELGERVLIFEDDFMALLEMHLVGAGFVPESDVWRIFHTAPWRPVMDALPHLAINERFDFMMEDCPDDWDVLYLGGGYQCAPLERITPHVVRNGGMLGTVAYAIKPRFAAAITGAVNERCPWDAYPGAVDMVLTSFAKDWRFYTLSPRLFIPRPGNVSDLHPGHAEGFPFHACDPVHEQMV